MENRKLARWNRWTPTLHLAGVLALTFLFLMAVLSWIVVNNVPTIHAKPINQAGQIKIGVAVPLSAPGDVSAGEAMKVAVEIAADEINAGGGVLGMPFQLVFSDTAGIAFRGAQAMDYFADENVAGVVGGYHSAVGLQMVGKAQEHHIPTIFAETWHDDITSSAIPEVFRIAPTTSMVDDFVANYLANELGYNSAVLVTDTSPVGQAIANSLRLALAAKGIYSEIKAHVPGETNFNPIITAIRYFDLSHINDSQAIIVLSEGDDAFNFIQQSEAAEIAPSKEKICVDIRSISDSEAFWDTPPFGNYCVFRYIGPLQFHYNTRTQDFATEYKSRTGKSTVEYYAMEAYDSLIIMADAINRAGSSDPDDIIAAIETTNLIGAQGLYYFPYGTNNPVPSGVPAYMWHQWPDPYILLLQYFRNYQTPEEAAVVHPPLYRTHEVNLIPYNGTGRTTVSTIDSSGGIIIPDTTFNNSGVSVTSVSSSTKIVFGPSVLTASTIISYTPFRFPFDPYCKSGSLTSPGGNHYFELTATYSDTGQLAQPAAGMSYSVVISYTDTEGSDIVEDTAALYWCDGNNWSQEGIASTVDITNNTVSANVSHFSSFAILGQALEKTYLPIILKSVS